jgi:hypothetical protein
MVVDHRLDCKALGGYTLKLRRKQHTGIGQVRPSAGLQNCAHLRGRVPAFWTF